ncbi:MAG: hypothetical protein KDH93_21280 [Rhodoferax sp.]|nr:hypothetical protein [Rhodoferax sp.]MCP5263658.1 hypothetical protein [Rhodoferax sp.]
MAEQHSKGYAALQALSDCLARRQPVPMAVLRQIDACWRHFTDGKPGGAYYPGVERNSPAPRSLGEAFGVPDVKGGSQLKRKRLALARPDLVQMFALARGRARLPRTKEGYQEAASRLGLTASEVEDWVLRHLAKPRPPKAPP